MVESALSAGRACLIGLWMGILSREDLHQIDREYYDTTIGFTSETYVAGGLSRWEEKAIDDHFGGARTLVVLGAGSGREMIALGERGYDVVGYECHSGLREAGARVLETGVSDAALRPMERDLCPDIDPGCDGIVIGWGTYMLIQGRDRRVRLLADLRDAVSPGTPLLLSFFVRKEGERRFRIAAAVARPLRGLLRRDPIELGDFMSPTYAHHFVEEELRSELADGGWDLVRYGDRDYGHAVATASAD
jgi:hypothetical protein